MKNNFVAKNMNIINKNSIHKNLKNQLERDDKYWINEELKLDSLSKEELEKISPLLQQSLSSLVVFENLK